MRFRRESPIVIAYAFYVISRFDRHYLGSRPLYGDWDVLRFWGWAPQSDGKEVPAVGLAVGTDVPANVASGGDTSEWESLDPVVETVTEDPDFLPGEVPLTFVYQNLYVEGPFRIQPRGRRLIASAYQTRIGQYSMSVGAVLQRV